MAQNRRRKVVLYLIFGIFSSFLCIAIATGAFFLGRQTAAVDTATVNEPLLEAATAEIKPRQASASDEKLDNPSGDRSEALVPPAQEETVEPTATSTVEPELEPREVTPTPEEVSALEPSEGSPDFTKEDLALLWEVWQIVESEYDGELPSDSELTYAVIRGLLRPLDDRFTRFAPPDVAERMREDLQGTFEGIGAFVRENEQGMAEIVRPMDGQPADLAGLQAGDVIVAVDHESMAGKSLEEVIALIRGPQGTDVVLSVRRDVNVEPFDVTITRDRIEIPIIESEMLDDNIAYVRLTSFNRNADAQLRQTLEELMAQNPRGLIFDLRDNPGGYLDQSIAVSDVFLPEGVVLRERSTVLGLDEAYRSESGDLAEEIPLVVLVNAGSASASEIVAGAIKDRERGVLIGETTFGKGSVQQSHTLTDGSELRVTIARWFTPNDTSIDGTGIEPDIEVATPEDLGGEDDIQLDRAIEFLLTGE